MIKSVEETKRMFENSKKRSSEIFQKLQANITSFQQRRNEYVNCNASIILEPEEDFEPGDKCFVEENEMLLISNEKEIKICDYWIEDLTKDMEDLTKDMEYLSNKIEEINTMSKEFIDKYFKDNLN